MSTKLETLEEIDQYYRDRGIQKVIAYYCRYREIVIIKHLEDRDMVLRPFKIFKPEHFRWVYNRLHLDKIKFDIYISNASVKLPILPSHPKELKEARKLLNETWMERLTGYDFFVDIDPSCLEDEPKLIAWAKQIINKRHPMEIWATGSGGVHIIEKGQFDPEFVKNTILDICCELQLPLRHPIKTINNKRYTSLNGKWVLIPKNKEIPETKKPYIDNNIYDIRRIRRVPFSIHSKTGIPMRKIL